jgi:hypothetical protein
MNFSTSTSNNASGFPDRRHDSSRYRHYLKSLLIGFFASWLLFGVAAFAQIGASTPSATWMAGLYATKHRLADAVTQPKILVVAGSSTLFGVSAEMIQQSIQIPTINLGVHAGLGIDYLLHRAQEFAKPGDTVLLAPEYELYMSDYKNSNTLVGYVFGHDPGYILQHPQMLFELSLERLIYGLGVKLKVLPTQQSTGYDDKDLNGNGDSIANRESMIGEKQQAQLDTLEPFIVKSNVLENPAAFQKIKAFLNWCHDHKVNVIATWPNTLWFDRYAEPKYQRLFDDIHKFYETAHVPIAGTSREFMYEKSWFFDTIYHLHDRAVKARTEQLITHLKPLV